jgi:putative PEP-CTERM system TPR-repeat lipoprotein
MINFKKSFAIALMLGLIAACTKKTSEEHIEAARQFIAENNNPAAIVELKNAVKLAPKSAEARFELGQLYITEKKFESAEKELNRALEYGYQAAKILPLLTRAYQRTGAYSALSKLEHQDASLTSVEQAEIGYFKVLSLVRLDKQDEARLLIDELIRIDTRSVFKGLASAYTTVLDGKFEQAIEQVKLLKDQAPQNAEVLKLLAQLHLTLKQPQDAATVFKDYVQLYPDDYQTMFVLAKLLVDLGQTDKAEKYVDKLLEINQQNALLNQLKAAARAAEQDFPNAQRYAEVAIQNGLADPSVRLIAGYSAYQQQDFESANLHLSYVASSLPDNHPGLKLLAASQLQLGLSSEANEVLGRLDDLTEQDAPLFSKASYELLRSGFEKDAKALLDRSLPISNTAEDLTRLGLLQLSLNNLDGIVNLEDALVKSPQLASAKTTLATAYIATKQYNKALELANSWKQTDAKDLAAYMLAAEVHLSRKDYELAQTELELALNINSQYIPAKMALINVQLSKGNNQKALQDLQVLLNESPDYIPALATYYFISKQQGEPASGVQKAEQAHRSDPSNIQLRLLLARMYLAEEQYQPSIDLLDGIKDQAKLPTIHWKLRGQALIRSNQRKAANDHYDAWLSESPNDKDATMGKLLLLDSQNMFAQGLALTVAFLENRDDLQMQLLNTHFLIMSANYPAARAAYDRLPARMLSLPMVKGFLARLQLVDKKPKEALANATIAYKATPNNRNLVLMLFSLDQLDKPEQGMVLLSKHVEQQPKDLAARMLLAERQISIDTSIAATSYEEALKLNPNNYVASNNIAFLYLQMGETAKAKVHALKAVELQPNNSAAVDTLAQIFVAEQDYAEAIKYYDRVISDKMHDEEIYLNYVEALFAGDRAVLAKRKLEQRELVKPVSVERISALKAKYKID